MKKCWNNIAEFISEYNILLCLFALYVFLAHALEIQNCFLKLLFGIPCPGCGMSRAAFSLLRFDFVKAFQYNPFIFGFPFVFLGIAFQHTKWVKKIVNNTWVWISVLIVILVVYVLRWVFLYPDVPMDYFPHSLLSLIISIFK